MFEDESRLNCYEYGDEIFWDARYMEEGGATFDWYQRYSALQSIVRKFVPISSRILMAGCGSAAMSEHMVLDGYEEIINIDISSIVIEMMRKKYCNTPGLKYVQMDVRDMSFFPDRSFDCVIDKGTLDSLMCGIYAQISAFQMLREVNRVLKPGGVYMLITYGEPSLRIHHLTKDGRSWKILLYILPRPGFRRLGDCGSSSRRSAPEPVPLTEKGLLPPGFAPEDPDSHYVYVCIKLQRPPSQRCLRKGGF
ncbi:S-adenosyl-L-methionine-dependent methyltransferases superfamily protein [Wolffia australiana]